MIMKRVDRPQLKGSAIPKQSHFLSQRANVNNNTEPTSRKNPAKSLQKPIKYGQSDLREQNRQLVETNEELERRTSELKEHVTALEKKCSDIQAENTDIKKQLWDCHTLLLAESLDPVSGEKIGKTAEQTAAQREELMTVSQHLLTELKLFDEVAREHASNLLNVQNTTKCLREAREKLQQDRESFCLDAEEMERALQDAESLLIK